MAPEFSTYRLHEAPAGNPPSPEDRGRSPRLCLQLHTAHLSSHPPLPNHKDPVFLWKPLTSRHGSLKVHTAPSLRSQTSGSSDPSQKGENWGPQKSSSTSSESANKKKFILGSIELDKKVNSGFSVRCYRKTQTDFLTNPTETGKLPHGIRCRKKPPELSHPVCLVTHTYHAGTWPRERRGEETVVTVSLSTWGEHIPHTPVGGTASRQRWGQRWKWKQGGDSLRAARARKAQPSVPTSPSPPTSDQQFCVLNEPSHPPGATHPQEETSGQVHPSGPEEVTPRPPPASDEPTAKAAASQARERTVRAHSCSQ